MHKIELIPWLDPDELDSFTVDSMSLRDSFEFDGPGGNTRDSANRNERNDLCLPLTSACISQVTVG